MGPQVGTAAGDQEFAEQLQKAAFELASRPERLTLAAADSDRAMAEALASAAGLDIKLILKLVDQLSHHRRELDTLRREVARLQAAAE